MRLGIPLCNHAIIHRCQGIADRTISRSALEFRNLRDRKMMNVHVARIHQFFSGCD